MNLRFQDGFDFVKQDLDSLGYWEKRTTEYIKRNLKKGQTFTDIGAQVGYFTVLVSQLGAGVIAFEPSTKNRELLLENIQTNKCKNVTVFNQALSDKRDVAKLYTGKTSGENSLEENYHKGEGFEEVDLVKYDDLEL